MNSRSAELATSSFRHQEQGIRRQSDVPRKWPVAEAQPFFLKNFRLQMVVVRIRRRLMHSQEKRGAKRCFRRPDEPAGKDIFARRRRRSPLRRNQHGGHEFRRAPAFPRSDARQVKRQPQSIASISVDDVAFAREKFLQPVSRATSTVGGWRNTCSLSPYAATRPRESTISRSPSRYASSMLCVTTSTGRSNSANVS